MSSDVIEIMARAIERLNPTWKDAEEEARAALTALEAAGYVAVPREPTEGIRNYILAFTQCESFEEVGNWWSALLSASKG